MADLQISADDDLRGQTILLPGGGSYERMFHLSASFPDTYFINMDLCTGAEGIGTAEEKHPSNRWHFHKEEKNYRQKVTSIQGDFVKSDIPPDSADQVWMERSLPIYCETMDAVRLSVYRAMYVTKPGGIVRIFPMAKNLSYVMGRNLVTRSFINRFFITGTRIIKAVAKAADLSVKCGGNQDWYIREGIYCGAHIFLPNDKTEFNRRCADNIRKIERSGNLPDIVVCRKKSDRKWTVPKITAKDFAISLTAKDR